MGITCLIFVYFVWSWTESQINFYMSRINSGQERMAQVKTKNHSVTRNHGGQLLWQDIDVGEVVYLNNSIQTEKNSFTEILFDDGEKILIGPESLVRFIREEDKISLQLVDGKIEVKSPDKATQQTLRLDNKKPSRLVIKTPRGRLNLNNSDIKIQAVKDQKQNFKIEVTRGSPTLTTATKKEILKVSKNSEPTEKIVVVPNKLLTPSKVKSVEPKMVRPIVVTPKIIKPEPSATPAPVPISISSPAPVPVAKPAPTMIPPPIPVIKRQPASPAKVKNILAPPKVKSIKVRGVQ